MKQLTLSMIALAALCFIMAKCEKDDDKPVNLPAAVQQFISENYPGYSAEEKEEETQCDGAMTLEVELEGPNDAELDLVFDLDGKFLFSEKEIPLSSLPAQVTNVIAAQYPDYSAKVADQVTMADGTLRYEVELKGSNQVLEVLFDASGEKLCEVVDDGDDQDE